jgi:hypothetical protein
MTYADAQQQAQQEQLDWLAEQTALLRQQALTLGRIARHTGFIYGLAVAWCALVCLGFLVVLVQH